MKNPAGIASLPSQAGRVQRKVIHFIHHPIFAEKFVLPALATLKLAGYDVLVAAPKAAKNIILASGLTWYEGSPAPSFNLFSLPLSILRIVWTIVCEKPDAIHAHTTRGALVPLSIAWLLRVKIRIYHNHGFPCFGHRGILGWALRYIECANIFFSNKVLSVSISNLEQARSIGLLNANEGLVIGAGSATGIDCEEFDPTRFSPSERDALRASLGIQKSDIVCLYVGRPVARKGFHFILRTWRDKIGQDSRLHLVVAGATTAQCARVIGNMPENIHAVGFYKEMARLYFSADIVLLPSFHEGLGYAILEGAAMGKPQIGSDLAGIRCAIRNGVTGLLFNVGCEESFFSCLQKLLHDESLRATLGKASRDLMLEKFSRREIVAAYVEFYRQIFIEFDQRDTEG